MVEGFAVGAEVRYINDLPHWTAQTFYRRFFLILPHTQRWLDFGLEEYVSTIYILLCCYTVMQSLLWISLCTPLKLISGEKTGLNHSEALYQDACNGCFAGGCGTHWWPLQALTHGKLAQALLPYVAHVLLLADARGCLPSSDSWPACRTEALWLRHLPGQSCKGMRVLPSQILNTTHSTCRC